MDIQKFTERTQGFLQAASTIAIREFHQRITPEHLLKALLDDEEGAASGLIKAAGGDPKAVQTANDAEIGELIACGSHLILFTTGRGSVVGSAISPVIKICANPEICRSRSLCQ